MAVVVVVGLQEWHAVELDAQQRDGGLVAVQYQVVVLVLLTITITVTIITIPIGIRGEKELGSDDRGAVANVKVHVDFFDDNLQGLVIAAKDFDRLGRSRSGAGRGAAGTHLEGGGSTCSRCSGGSRGSRCGGSRCGGTRRGSRRRLRCRLRRRDGRNGRDGARRKGRSGSGCGEKQPGRNVSDFHESVVVNVNGNVNVVAVVVVAVAVAVVVVAVGIIITDSTIAIASIAIASGTKVVVPGRIGIGGIDGIGIVAPAVRAGVVAALRFVAAASADASSARKGFLEAGPEFLQSLGFVADIAVAVAIAVAIAAVGIALGSKGGIVVKHDQWSIVRIIEIEYGTIE